MTLTRNQIVAKSPPAKKINLAGIFLLRKFFIRGIINLIKLTLFSPSPLTPLKKRFPA
jgi:hypothetical protein